MIRLVLPWPPSANNSKIPVHTRSRKTGKFITRQISTDELREYKILVTAIGLNSGKSVPGRVHVIIRAFEPNNRRRDVANLEKAPIDALVTARVIEDDCKIDHLEIIRERVVPLGRLVVEIEEIKEAR